MPRAGRCSSLRTGHDESRARQIARAVDLAARYGPYRANCLKRSLVLGYFLTKNDITCDLILGAEITDQGTAAHAWVEYFGVVLNDRQDVGQRFNAFLETSTKSQNYE